MSLAEVKSVLRRRGWVQLTEWDITFRSDKDTDALQSLREWRNVYQQGLAACPNPQARKHSNVAPDLEQMLRTGGFAEVVADVQDIPIGTWRRGKCSRVYVVMLRQQRHGPIYYCNTLLTAPVH